MKIRTKKFRRKIERIRLHNPFRKVKVETIGIMPNYEKYHGTNFIETHKYESTWIREDGVEWLIKWMLRLNPLVWLFAGIFVLCVKVGWIKEEITVPERPSDSRKEFNNAWNGR